MSAERISNMSYSEFCEFIDTFEGEDRMIPILDYPDFSVYFDLYFGGYFYLERGENDASDFFEIEEIAKLEYSVINDLLIPHDEAGEFMSRIFDCTVCGERVLDDRIEYLWFKRKE